MDAGRDTDELWQFGAMPPPLCAPRKRSAFTPSEDTSGNESFSHPDQQKKNVPTSPISPRPDCLSGECDALGRVFARCSRQMHVLNIKRGRVLVTGGAGGGPL